MQQQEEEDPSFIPFVSPIHKDVETAVQEYRRISLPTIPPLPLLPPIKSQPEEKEEEEEVCVVSIPTTTTTTTSSNTPISDKLEHYAPYSGTEGYGFAQPVGGWPDDGFELTIRLPNPTDLSKFSEEQMSYMIPLLRSWVFALPIDPTSTVHPRYNPPTIYRYLRGEWDRIAFNTSIDASKAMNSLLRPTAHKQMKTPTEAVLFPEPKKRKRAVMDPAKRREREREYRKEYRKKRKIEIKEKKRQERLAKEAEEKNK
eukprot:TRINITY_DN14120_c0_g1_i1.p1 TRINITY_DN14120_c0_g1~~TRINITY_DN14120_c0_g1_i1.p1  ORF type:complete len:257 (+),score=53.66 TRINITY_DN14120_c0_g1_i1:211-981(+)